MYNKRVVFWAACMGLMLFGIGLITLGSLAPDLKTKFALDDVSTGTLFSILPFGILAGSLVFGPVCDQYGYKKMLLLSCLGMFAGFEGIAFSASLFHLKLFVFLFGVSAGIINGATNAVVSDISKGEEAANLSLLGVFFGIGALGMPFLLGLLKNQYSSFHIVAAVGFLSLFILLFYSFVRFPPSKKELGFELVKKADLFKTNFLYLIAFFLFFQGSAEAIMNNWTTIYFTQHLGVAEAKALFALTVYVLGLIVMRLLLGTLLRHTPLPYLTGASLVLVFSGIVVLYLTHAYFFAVSGLILIGLGLAAGFPVMLGMAGSRFAAQSGTAFSFIFTVVLLGNMAINYLMGVIARQFGMQHLTTVVFVEWVFMALLSVFIYRSQRKDAATQVMPEVS